MKMVTSNQKDMRDRKGDSHFTTRIDRVTSGVGEEIGVTFPPNLRPTSFSLDLDAKTRLSYPFNCFPSPKKNGAESQ